MSQRTPKRLAVSETVYDLITQRCVEVYLQEHPSMDDVPITHNFILKRIAEYYVHGGEQ